MSIQEFRAGSSAYVKRVVVVVVLTVLTMIAGFAVVGTFRDSLLAFYRRHFSETVADSLLGASAPLPALLVLVAGLCFGELRARRDARLRCPHCGKTLMPVRFVVVATRNCGYCGERVLAEPADSA